MNTYLGFAYQGAEAPEKNAFAEGEKLATSCCEQLKLLGEKPPFPPKLLVLLATPKYLEEGRANDLVTGIGTFFSSHFENSIPLIGSSVAAVAFDQKIHQQGAVLICLASNLLNVVVGATTELAESPEDAVENLVEALELSIGKGRDPNPQENRELLLFLPGKTEFWEPSRLFHDISEGLGYRLPITGGVSHPMGSADAGLQFTEFGAQRGAIVAARLEFQVPIASRLSRSLYGTGQYVTYEKRPDLTFDLENEAVRKQIQTKHFAVLGEKIEDRYRAMVVLGPDGHVCRTLAPVEDKRLELLAVEPEEIVHKAKFSIQEPARRFQLENPAGCIAFQCASCYSLRKEIGLDLEDLFIQMKQALHGAPVVGGFFDGEMGVDHTGQSMFANWAGAVLTFGDEMSERAIWERGFKAIAANVGSLNQAASLQELITFSLDMICAAGYPGALISLVLPGSGQDWIVAQEGRGRFANIVDSFRSRWSDEKELSAIAKKEELPEFANGETLRYLPDCRSSFPEKLLWRRDIISQYVIPLFELPFNPADAPKDRNLLGFIHVDLGDSSKKPELRATEKHVLDSLAEAIESSLRRVLSEEEAKLMRTLDQAMGQALLTHSADEGRQKFVQDGVKAFSAVSGYIRMLRGHELEICAGDGPYYEAVRKVRPKIDSTDKSFSGQAFVRGESRAVNDPRMESVYSNFWDRFSHDEKYQGLMEEGKNAGSYIVAVLKNAIGRNIGTVIFIAKRSWHFHKFHGRCLDTFSNRLRWLGEHLEKIGPADFLLQVWKDLPDQAHSLTLEPPLSLLVENFRKASHAQTASVFLWDDSFQKFVLRAQVGWIEKGWEFAAYYEKHEGWTGSVAMEDEARYAPDMVAHKIDIGTATGPNEKPQGIYEKVMFGEPNGQITEGLGLPLKAGKKLLGVLTAYRRYTQPAQEDSLTRDPETLRWATNYISDYVSTILLQKAERLEKERRERIEGIYDQLLRAGEKGPVRVLCDILPEIYKAEKVLFYVPVEQSETLECIGSSQEKESPDERVSRAGREMVIDTYRMPIVPAERRDPAKAATHGAIRRACLPLALTDLLGVLDIHWPKNQTRQEQIVKFEELRILSMIVRSVYQRYLFVRARREAEQKLAALEEQGSYLVDAMVAPARQALHRCNNVDVDLEDLAKSVKAKTDQNILLDQIERIRFRTRQIPRAMRFLKTGARPARAAERVDNLLQDAIKQSNWGEIQCKLSVPQELEVYVSRGWIVEAFFNIVDNAILAIYDKGEKAGIISISATHFGDKARIIFKDNGIGMTKAELDMLHLPYGGPAKRGRSGVGTSLTRVLLRQQGGELSVSSKKGFGTEVTVELPLATMEKEHARTVRANY